MAALTSASLTRVPFSISNRRNYRRLPIILASSSSAMPSHEPSSSSSSSTEIGSILSSPKAPFVDSSKPPQNGYIASPNGSPLVKFVQHTESTIERAIFDFRFLALLAVGGSLAGSLLCFLNGCVYIVDAYKVYWTSCVKGIHTGQMVLRLVEAIDHHAWHQKFDLDKHLSVGETSEDVYLAGTVMLIFGMGLYGLFITNVSPDVHPTADRALKQSSLFGMFALKERPKWMKISSLDELKTKVGHVIVMILLVKMFERSKMVTIATGTDLLSYSVCIFLSSASLYILHNLHKSD
uniref:Structural constituent of ribosome n=1 Tax=Solanum lycopersicum TaxID=4081 RepID=A0A3Q7EJ86_SOLLC